MTNETSSLEAPKPTGFRSLDRVLNVVGALAAIAATIYGMWVKVQVDNQSRRVEDLKASISQSAEARENRKLELEMTMKVFDEVKDIYKADKQSPDILVNRLSAVSALVLAVPNQEIRERLGQAVGAALSAQTSNGGSESAQKAQSVKANLEAAIFDAATVAESAPTEAVSTRQIKALAAQSSAKNPHWGALNYNLFWCEDVENPNAALEAAKQASALKKLDREASGDWRVRKLPRSVNERSGYQIHRNLIRTSSKEETAIGNVLVGVLAQYGMAGFVVEEVSYPSPASISVFFCANASRNPKPTL